MRDRVCSFRKNVDVGIGAKIIGGVTITSVPARKIERLE